MERLVAIAKALSSRLGALSFGPPVTHTYDPLTYAWGLHEAYLQRFGAGEGRVVLLGMNPGPYGMSQTGVPFGSVPIVRDWLGLAGAVTPPQHQHPKRPILGLDHPRAEVSGERLWGWARDRFGTPEAFFERFFVVNYCPLCFLEASGRNRTPDKLSASERSALFDLCDEALAETVAALRPSVVVGVGAFAAGRATNVVGDTFAVGRMLHPSPASPAANGGWAEKAEADLIQLGVVLPGRE